MLDWLRSLSRTERLTIIACFLGWTLDAMDTQAANLLVPSLATAFAVSKSAIGAMATGALVASGVGGWLAGAASDRLGRIKVLQITIVWFSLGSLLCGLAQNFPELVAARLFQGLGFGGEWAVGAVLVAEITQPRHRGVAVGVVQSGYSVGLAGAAGLYFAAYSLLPDGLAWRAVFVAGVLPALLVLFVRRSLREPTRVARGEVPPATSLSRIFTRPYLGVTVIGSLLCLTLQGASFGISVWLPTLLKVDYGFSLKMLSSFFLLQSIGAFAGYLAAAAVGDALGRRVSLGSFTLGAMITIGSLCFAPLDSYAQLALALPFGFFAFGLYSNFGPVLSELYPAGIRGSGQGFCYNFGRGVGAVFPAIVGYGSTRMPLATIMGSVTLTAYLLACVIILVMPETRGRVIDGGAAEPVPAH